MAPRKPKPVDVYTLTSLQVETLGQFLADQIIDEGAIVADGPLGRIINAFLVEAHRLRTVAIEEAIAKLKEPK